MNCDLDRACAHGRHWRWRACGLLAALAIAPAGAWAGARVRVVDTDVDTRTSPDLVCTAGGDILVIYGHVGDQALKVARITSTATTRTSLDIPSAIGTAPSAALDSLGLLSVCHIGGNGALFYTLVGGDVFGLSTVTIPTPGETAYLQAPVHVLDSLDRPFVAYRGNQNLARLARFDISSGKWMVEPIPGSTVNNSNPQIAIAMDREGHPAVAHCDQLDSLRLATRTPNGWTLRTHALGTPPALSGLALDFDSSGAAYVAVAPATELSILRFGALSVTKVYSPGLPWPVMFGPHSMRVDGSDQISFVYYDLGRGTVEVLRRTALWSTTVVDTSSRFGPPALTLDPSNRWVIAYVDALKGQMKVSAKAWWDFARPDFNDDGHVDSRDLGYFAACLTGPGVTQSELNCLDADLDNDGDVDLSDFGVYQACYSGPVEAANPQCAD